MAFTYPVPGTPLGPFGFLPRITPVTALWLNYVAHNMALAVDGIGGGYYGLTADLNFAGIAGKFRLNFATPATPAELRGYTVFDVTDDAAQPLGVGSVTFKIPVTFDIGASITYEDQVTFNNPVTFTNLGDITLQSGCVLTAQSGATITAASGSTTTLGGATNVSSTGTLTVQSSGALTAASGSTTSIAGTLGVSGTATFSGRRVIRRGRVSLSDANHTVDVTQGDRFELAIPAAPPHVITLKDTSPAVPAAGECLEFILPMPVGTAASGPQYTFQREDTTVVASFRANTASNSAHGAMYAEFEYVGGVWRLGANSGASYDGATHAGVIAEAGA